MTEKSNRAKYFMVVMGILIIEVAVYLGFFRSNEEVVARVGEAVISKEELYNFMVQQTGEEALDNLITKKIIELEADQQNIEVTEADIDKRVEELAEYYGGQDAMTTTLAMYNITLDQVRDDVAVNVKLEKLLKSRIEITDKEVQEYFKANQADFFVEEQIKVSHILVETEAEAQEIKALLAEGQDFAKLAQERSTDTLTKNQGGDLGTASRGAMVAEFEQAAFALQPGQISDPVKSEYGYHIIKVDEKTEARQGTLEESKDEIREILFQQKMESEYPAWLEEQYDKYQVEKLLP